MFDISDFLEASQDLIIGWQILHLLLTRKGL